MQRLLRDLLYLTIISFSVLITIILENVIEINGLKYYRFIRKIQLNKLLKTHKRMAIHFIYSHLDIWRGLSLVVRISKTTRDNVSLV